MTTDPEPLSAATLHDAMLAVVSRDGFPYGGGEALTKFSEAVFATLDEARATPSGDLAAAAQHVADLYEMGAGGDDWWTALDHLVAGLRSVSADSTAGLDVLRERWTASEQCSGSPRHFGGCGCLCHSVVISDTSGDTA